MIKEVDVRISDYEKSVRRLKRLMETGSVTDHRVREVDKVVSRAFNALLDEDLETTAGLLERVDYLLKLIRASNPNDEILQRLVDTLWKDIVRLQVKRTH